MDEHPRIQSPHPAVPTFLQRRGSRSLRVKPFLLALAALLALSRQSIRGEEPTEGFTEPYQQVELAAGEQGLLTEILVREGARVKAGQRLGSLDTLVLEKTLDIARQRSTSLGALKGARAEAELRRKYVDQLSTLRDRGSATQRELDRAETDLAVAEARVVMAEEELELQRLECLRIEAQIDRRQLRSPIDGIISEVHHEAGESVLGNDARVLTIVQINRLHAKFSATPAQCHALALEQPVTVNFPDLERDVLGRVESIAPVVDAKSGTQLITVVIDNSKEDLNSGARCLLMLERRATDAPEPVTRYTSQPSGSRKRP